MIPVGFALVVKDPQHTENLFGDLSDVADKTLQVADRNDIGDCLCMVTEDIPGTEKKKKYLVDVDHRDVVRFAQNPLHQVAKL